MKFRYWDSFFLNRDKSRNADRDIPYIFLARAAMFEQQNLNGGYFLQKYSYKCTYSYIYKTAIAYYYFNNIMYKASYIPIYVCYIYVASNYKCK